MISLSVRQYHPAAVMVTTEVYWWLCLLNCVLLVDHSFLVLLLLTLEDRKRFGLSNGRNVKIVLVGGYSVWGRTDRSRGVGNVDSLVTFGFI